MTSQTELRVVSELWTMLESSLLAQAKHLVRDLAAEEGVDPKQLWEKVKQTCKVTALELPEPLEPTFCPYQLREGVIAEKCLRPVLLGHSYCPTHCGRLSPSVPLNQFLPKVKRLQNEADPGDIYFQRLQGSGSTLVYSRDLTPVGVYHESKIIRFHFDT
jgi:hypothetical protein